MFNCEFCKLFYSRKSSLTLHIKKKHPDKWGSYKEHIVQSKFRFHCECGRNYNSEFNFKAHQNSHKELQIKQVKCPECSNLVEKKRIIAHFGDVHNIDIECETKRFDSMASFQNWKESYESKFKCFFCKTTGKVKIKEGTVYTYACNRSGSFVSKSKGMRSMKMNGSFKINGYCPASLYITEKENEVICKIIHTHVGHENELRCCRFTKTEKEEIANKLRQGVSFEQIIDDIRGSSENKDNRIHLLNRKDIHNIAFQFNLKNKSPNDNFDSIESLISEWGHSVLYYKNQNSMCEKYPCLDQNDFFLILSNEVQTDVLQRFGDNVICIDSMHETSSHDFQLTTLMVIDDIHYGFPCAFMYSNRIDYVALEVMFKEIKSKIGPIKAKVFMSDIANTYYNAFESIFDKPQHRLFCNWHIEEAWRENLSKIKPNEKKIKVYKMLKTLMHETDKNIFSKTLEYVMSYLENDLDTTSFHDYFKTYEKDAAQWSYAYRTECKIDTNNQLESMHQMIKYVYFNKKHPRNIYESTKIIMKFIQDKLFKFNTPITLSKGKIQSKLATIRNNHKRMLDSKMDFETENDYWIVCKNYKVQLNGSSCRCNLRCNECNSCIHTFSCSCTDYLIHWTMCRHIHCVAYNVMMEKSERNNVECDYNIVENDYEIVENDYEIVENDCEIVENDCEIVENDYGIVENEYYIIENDYDDIVENQNHHNYNIPISKQQFIENSASVGNQEAEISRKREDLIVRYTNLIRNCNEKDLDDLFTYCEKNEKLVDLSTSNYGTQNKRKMELQRDLSQPRNKK